MRPFGSRAAGTTEAMRATSTPSPRRDGPGRGPGGRGRRGVYRRSVLDALARPITWGCGTAGHRGWAFGPGIVVHPAPAGPTQPVLSAARTDAAVRSSIHGTDELAGLRPWRQGEDQRACTGGRPPGAPAGGGGAGRPGRPHPLGAGARRHRRSRPADEASLAVVAATWMDQVVAGQRGAGARLDGRRHPLPAAGGRPAERPGLVRLDRRARVPTPAVVLEALPARTDALTVMVSVSTPAAWVQDLSQFAARQGVRSPWAVGGATVSTAAATARRTQDRSGATCDDVALRVAVLVLDLSAAAAVAIAGLVPWPAVAGTVVALVVAAFAAPQGWHRTLRSTLGFASLLLAGAACLSTGGLGSTTLAFVTLWLMVTAQLHRGHRSRADLHGAARARP